MVSTYAQTVIKMEKSKLEKNIDRILQMQGFADAGICGEYHGIVPKCPIYRDDCAGLCTYAKEINEMRENVYGKRKKERK